MHDSRSCWGLGTVPTETVIQLSQPNAVMEDLFLKHLDVQSNLNDEFGIPDFLWSVTETQRMPVLSMR
eukprot:2945123-Rhodomonas_salina.2